MKTEIYNKSGLLSQYGLCCGYVEKGKNETELYKENGVFVVLGYGKRFCYDSLTEARQVFKDFQTFTIKN